MNCKDIEKEIELYVLGGTDPARSRQIELHLRGCPKCRLLQRECEKLLLELKTNGRSSLDEQRLIDGVRSVVRPMLPQLNARRRIYQLVPIAAALVLAATIWLVGMIHSDRSSTSSSFRIASAPGKRLWQKASAVATGVAQTDDIVIHDGTIFLLLENDAGQAVSAVESDSGETLWQSELASCGYLTADDERVYCVVLADQAKVQLLALDRRTGHPVWTFATQQTTSVLYGSSTPTVMPGHCICWVHEGSAYAIDARTGEQIWCRTFPEEKNLSQAAVIGRNVYVAGRNGIYCLDGADGRTHWQLPSRYEALFVTKPMTAVGRDRLFVVMGDRNGKSRIQCINTTTHRTLWQKSVPRVSHLFADSTNVYLRCQQVLALDQADGEPLWTIEATGCSPITACDNTICFIDSAREGSLVAARPDDGDIVWKIPGLHSCHAFVKVGQRGYLQTNDSVLLAFAFDS